MVSAREASLSQGIRLKPPLGMISRGDNLLTGVPLMVSSEEAFLSHGHFSVMVTCRNGCLYRRHSEASLND